MFLMCEPKIIERLLKVNILLRELIITYLKCYLYFFFFFFFFCKTTLENIIAIDE